MGARQVEHIDQHLKILDGNLKFCDLAFQAVCVATPSDYELVLGGLGTLMREIVPRSSNLIHPPEQPRERRRRTRTSWVAAPGSDGEEKPEVIYVRDT